MFHVDDNTYVIFITLMTNQCITIINQFAWWMLLISNTF